MKDIVESRSRAIVRDKWCFGERMNRVGDPFEWIDGRQMNMLGQLEGTNLALQYLAMSGEIYETPAAIRPADFKQALNTIRANLMRYFHSLVPFSSAETIGFQDYLESTATVKAQDYGFIRTHLTELPDRPTQIDIGPGLGANALYSTLCLSARYIAVDANPYSYSAQRSLFRFAAGADGRYLDTIDAESIQVPNDQIRSLANSNATFDIVHLPSWNFDWIHNESANLVSATWVLNEVNPAGIAWLLFQIDRCLRVGGYVYIRDSEKLKPNRHSTNYDQALQALGYTTVARLDVRNRIDMHGIPRAYQKTETRAENFESFFDRLYGRFAVTTHGGAFQQNAAS